MVVIAPSLTRVAAAARAAFRRLGRDRKGAAAVEFAMVAGPFFVFLFAIIQIAYMLFVSVMIESAVLDSARKVRTGQMQFQGASAEDFWNDLCEGVSLVASCEDHLYVDIQVLDDFGSSRIPSPVENGEFDPSDLGTDFGEAGDIVLVRAFYVWDVLIPGLGTGLANLKNNQRLIVSTTAFRNEPFGEIATTS